MWLSGIGQNILSLLQRSQAGELNKEDAMDRCKWRKVIKDVSCGVVCTAAGCNENDYVHLWCQSYLTEQLKCGELRATLWIDDIITMVQWNRLKWYGHVLRKDDDYWVKKCMQCEVENVKPVGRSRKLPSEWGYRKDCQARQQCEADAVDYTKWRKSVKDLV